MVLGKNIKKCGCSFFVGGQKILIGNKFRPPQIVDGDPFSTGKLQKWYIFCVWSPHFCQGYAPATPLKSATLWGSCCLKTTLVVFDAKNCWFYQNLKKMGTTNENWLMRHVGGNNLLPICCHRGPPPICCQFVILLKS